SFHFPRATKPPSNSDLSANCRCGETLLECFDLSKLSLPARYQTTQQLRPLSKLPMRGNPFGVLRLVEAFTSRALPNHPATQTSQQTADAGKPFWIASTCLSFDFPRAPKPPSSSQS